VSGDVIPFPGDRVIQLYDPRNEDVRTITIGAKAQYCVRVSAEDYDYLMQWPWTFKISDKRHGNHVYARRCIRVGPRKENRRVTIMMHDVILDRMGLPRPTDRHTGDHIDTDTLNNTRGNLRWLCKSGQRRNQKRMKEAA